VTVTISDWLIIAATLLSPVTAIQVQKLIERAAERRNAQQSIFHTLMATRATRLAPSHVQALNRIDLEFGKTKWRRQSARQRDVTHRWRIYADHLHDLEDESPPARLEAWVRRGDDLFINLLAALGAALNYRFDEVQLRRGIYHPKGHTEAELRQATRAPRHPHWQTLAADGGNWLPGQSGGVRLTDGSESSRRNCVKGWHASGGAELTWRCPISNSSQRLPTSRWRTRRRSKLTFSSNWKRRRDPLGQRTPHAARFIGVHRWLLGRTL
jgi:hypothetical protein